MSDFDDRVQRALDRQVRGVDEQPDFDDLSDRMTRRERRRNRVLVSMLVVSLFAGPALGFVAGRGAAGDDGGDVQAVGSGGEGDGSGVEVGDTGAPPVLSGGPATTIPPGTATDVLGPDGAAVTRNRVATEYFWGSSEPMARLFVRDAGATRVRAYRAATEPYDDGIPWWDAPAYCMPSGWVQADVSTELAVGIASGSTYSALRDRAVAAQLTLIGLAESDPRWIVVAQAPADAVSVRASFPGGGTDEMAPVEGIAVLVAPAADGATYDDQWQTKVTVEALDASGAVIASGDTSAGYTEVSTDDCSPPPEPMPEPGEEQPADPAAARAEIEAMFGKRWDETTDEERLANLDDTRGIQEVYDQLVTGPYADAVKSARSVLRDVVFLSASRAALRFDTEVDGYSADAFANQLTEAVYVDGRWKLTREGFCRQIQVTGVTCPDV